MNNRYSSHYENDCVSVSGSIKGARDQVISALIFETYQRNLGELWRLDKLRNCRKSLKSLILVISPIMISNTYNR